ncbi:uncharacterized protein DSM5745_05769 [Aspergillus mulundensis]|uniref:Uncharacterized protein n=1 Tax=Aspergillus mulundensis TaxID=1810919 RepID=A0A3D8RXX4_9EURO|nr:hypothetical protein DSM5745_05769 [Aspergillus mulundensis]RDW78917.1 hypothetical protein DSM5745_05769 [Aspergillus mulundensis]
MSANPPPTEPLAAVPPQPPQATETPQAPEAPQPAQDSQAPQIVQVSETPTQYPQLSHLPQAPPTQPQPAPAESQPFQPLHQVVTYVENHKLASLILITLFYPYVGKWSAQVSTTTSCTSSPYVGYYDPVIATILSVVAVHQNRYTSWQARFAYLRWTSFASTFERALGGSTITVGLVISLLSPFPIASLTTVVLIAWQYIVVSYHKEIRRIAALTDEISSQARAGVDSSRLYASSVTAYEKAILRLVAVLVNDTGRYNLDVYRPSPGIGPLLTGNIEAITPAAKEATALVTTSCTNLPKALSALEHIKYLSDKANLLARHGEIAEADALLSQLSTALTTIREVEAQLLEAKTKAHDIAVKIHLDDLVASHKKIVDQLTAAAAAPPPAPPQPTPAPEEPRRADPSELPNAVTLRNPKVIVGGLSGAPEDIDDQAFKLDIPFAVSVYGHSSSTLWIIDNGMICLDQAPTASPASVRTGQQLPYRDGMAPYCLFPLWKDLKITKGKPHGIYWDVEGAAPNRKLIIEFYVTRYNMEDQYFHFLVILEEARQNVATFRYFDVQDQGAEGTVGVQGPQNYKLFSFNQRKISPGLELVFNTTPNVNRVETSSFECEPTRAPSCKQCEKDDVPCTQTKTPIRFSDVSGKIGKGATPSLMPRSRIPKKLVYVDETAELTAMYQHDDEIQRPTDGITAERSVPISRVSQCPPSNDATTEPFHGASQSRPSPPNDRLPPGPSVLDGLIKPPSTMPHSPNSTLEFGLLGYFIDHLSMWLDLCDPERHFQLVVPHRARRCPPLMNAILAASARHLTRVPKYRTASGAVEYDGRVLHDLTDETALHYHNKCIHDLLELGANPDQTGNEDLLAAAIILRFYEEIDYPLQDEMRDNELFLRVINMFIEAQSPDVPLPKGQISVTTESTASEAIDHFLALNETHSKSSPPTVSNTTLESRWYMSTLRQASFWVAFRQEVYSAFLKQRPLTISLSRCAIFRSFTTGEDALWTARLVIFAADVLEFCYGNTAHPPAATIAHHPTNSKERWTELNALSQNWITHLPSTFEPIYIREASPQKDEVFPEIRYASNIHVAGVQHLELARVLLAVYDPSIPRLGLGYRQSMRGLSEKLRAALLRLCGIAVYNRQNPPSLTTALLGIVVCGEYIADAKEQRALLGLLDELEFHHGWPVASYRGRLKGAWGWDGRGV